MRILIYGINFSPELTGIGKYTGEMAKWLSAQGHEVRVVTAPPYYPQWRVADSYVNNWVKSNVHVPSLMRREASIEQCNTDESGDLSGGRFGFSAATPGRPEARPALTIYRCPLWVPSRPSGLKRLLHLATFALSSFPVMLRQIFWRPDVVWVVEPALMCAPAAWATARISSAKAWLHIQDFEVDAAFGLGIIQAAWLKRFLLSTETWLMRRFDRVSTISTGMLGKLNAKGVASDKLQLFPNWVDISAISPDTAAGLMMRRELGLPAHVKIALYSGNMGEKQGLEYVIEAARALIAVDLILILCGDGASRSRLQTDAANLSNVRWLPLQPLEKLNALLNMADVHLLPQKRNAADLVMPSKLTGIFASGRPVIAMADPGTTVYDAVLGRGLIVAPEDARALASAITSLLADSAECERLGAEGRRYAVDTLGRDAILCEFEKNLLELI